MTQPTETELRVAKALIDAYNPGTNASAEFLLATAEERAIWCSMSRAAIRAMRDCTDEMVATAQSQHKADLNGLGRTIIGCLWVSMIDSASPPEDNKL